MSFNQSKYIQEYNKEHYKTFKVDLKIEEMQELETMLTSLHLTKAQFLRNSINELKFQLEVDKAFENKRKREYETLSHNSHQ